MEDKKNKKRKVAIIISSVLLVMVLMVSITYAYFTAKAASGTQTVTTGNLGLAFDDNTAIVRSSNISPIERDEVLTKATKKTFTVTNTGSEKLFVDISLDNITLPDELKRYDFLYALYEGDKNISIGSFEYASDSVDIGKYQVFNSGDSVEYNLYIWIEETNKDQSIMMDKSFSAKVTATGSAYWETPTEDFTYEVVDEATNSLKITGYTGSEKSISIPKTIPYTNSNSETVEGVVTIIGNTAFIFQEFTNVIIPNSVTTIGSGAFSAMML